jgi:hypothetical protein
MDSQIIPESGRAPNNKVLDLRQLARALGGEIVGGQVLCPGPGHSAGDRSLAVRPSAQPPFGFIVYSHAGDHWRGCRDYVLEKIGCWTVDALRRYQRSSQPHYRAKDHERRQHKKAAWLWSRRQPITGTPAELYLRGARGYSGLIPNTLAFLPAAKPEHHPAMIAAFGVCDEPEPGLVRGPVNVNSVHLTLLKPDGSGKAKTDRSKLIVGRPLVRPIALAPPNDLLGLGGLAQSLSTAATTRRLVHWATR